MLPDVTFIEPNATYRLKKHIPGPSWDYELLFNKCRQRGWETKTVIPIEEERPGSSLLRNLPR